jgi:excisionase family DNA binding protein
MKNARDTLRLNPGTASRARLGGSGGGSAARAPVVPRLALSPAEAAEALSVSRDFFDEHVLRELRLVRRGRRRLVPVRELQQWLDREASYPLADERGHRLP